MRWVLAAATVVVCALGVSAQAQPAQLPPSAYGRLPQIIDAALSPNGVNLVLAQSEADGSTSLRVINLDTQQIVYNAPVERPNKLRGVGWASDDIATFEISSSETPSSVLPQFTYVRGSQHIEYWRTGTVALSTHRRTFLLQDVDTNIEAAGAAGVIAPIEGDPGYGRMFEWRRRGQDTDVALYRVNLTTGQGAPVTSIGQDSDGCVLDERGALVACAQHNWYTNHWKITSTAHGDAPLLEGDSETGAPPGLMGLLPDGRLVVAPYPEDNGRGVIEAVNLTTGATEVLAQNDHYDVDAVEIDPLTRRVVGVQWIEDFPKQRFFDTALASAYSALSEQFNDGFAEIKGWSHDRHRILAYAETAHDGGAYYIFEPGRQQLVEVGENYPALQGSNLGVRQAITYAARDGVHIPAYLTLPPDAQPHDLPLVVLVHGGPAVRDDFSFDWWAEFLASRGYAVLQPNYRGSTGYGRAWELAGRHQWGDGRMQNDVTDGVDALVHAGVVDSHRVCIVGGSYGGYAALAGATLTPDKYACAVSIAGISDLVAMLDLEAAATHSEVADWWTLLIGDRHADRDHLRAISPVNLADNVKAPILLIHGSADTVVDPAQTQNMLHALQAAHKDVRFVELNGDDHWLSSGQQRTQMLTELESFLNANIGEGSHH